MDVVIIGANLISFSIYVLISYCGYLTYADSIRDNIILNCIYFSSSSFAQSRLFKAHFFLVPDTAWTFICRIAVSLLVIFSYPLQIHPCRTSLTYVARDFTYFFGFLLIFFRNLLKACFPNIRNHLSDNMIHYGLSFLLFVSTFLIAFFVKNLSTVCSKRKNLKFACFLFFF